MKLYTYRHAGSVAVGVQREDHLVDLSDSFPSMLALIEGGEAALKSAKTALSHRAQGVALADVEILAPIPRPGKILCSGLNYRSHVTENPNAVFLDDPRFFLKLPQTVIGPGAPILHPGLEFLVDYEVELAVVLSKPLYRPTQAEAANAVFGYTILHDVSSRFIQFKDKNEDMGKNFDSFTPMGPCLVTADEILDPSQLRLRLSVNGKTLQDGSNTDWCFPLPRLLAWFAMGITLHPGDVISTGTPAGIGYFRQPPVYLQPGDHCRLEIDGIGVLENPVRAIENPVHLELAIDRSQALA